VYYEISRCGDGTLDKDYWEECDPGSAWTSTLPDGRICNKDCKIESTPQSDWKVEIEKTLKDKKEVSSTGEILTWEVKVWAEWWDVTDFQIKDIVPFALEYKSYKVNKNDDNLTVSDPTWPVKVDTWNVYIWDVKWTLKKDHELLLEVTTEVVLMPTSQDD
jgi:cysteine-rich repeat protein